MQPRLAELNEPQSPISGPHLNGSASSGEEMRDEQNDCDHKQQMDRSERHVECDKSEQPQDEQNSGDSSEHDSSLFRSESKTVPTIRFSRAFEHQGKPLTGRDCFL